MSPAGALGTAQTEEAMTGAAETVGKKTDARMKGVTEIRTAKATAEEEAEMRTTKATGLGITKSAGIGTIKAMEIRTPKATATTTPKATETLQAPTEEDAGDSSSTSSDAAVPLTMSASVILSTLPTRASSALAATWAASSSAGEAKVVVRFKAIGNARALAQDVCKISAGRRFEEVVRYVRRKVGCAAGESVFCYVNNVFAPGLDEVVGNLHRCFRNSHDQLVVAYAMTPAFG